MNSRSPRSLSLWQSLQLACYSPKVVVVTNPVHLDVKPPNRNLTLKQHSQIHST